MKKFNPKTHIARMSNWCAAILLSFGIGTPTFAAERDLDAELSHAERLFYSGESEQAFAIYGELAELGCAKAQTRYGLLMERFKAYSDAEALSWIRRAAEQGHPHAQKVLGFAYDFGAWGLGPREFEKALPWYLRAAEQGHPGAMSELFQMYHFERGVEFDRAEAYKWLLLAAPRFPPPTSEPAYGMGIDHEARKLMIEMSETVAMLMTPEEIAEGERRAAAWEIEHNYIRHMPEHSDEPLPLWYQAIDAGCND